MERKIYFYKLIPRDEVLKRYKQNRILDHKFRQKFGAFLHNHHDFLDRNIPLKRVLEIKYSFERDLILIRDNPAEFNLIPWIGGPEKGVITARIGYGKERDLPTKIDEEGHENGIQLDKSRKERLYYPTHFVVFPNGIVGMERYKDGPTSYQLKYFLSQYLFGQASVVDLMEVYYREFIEELLRSPRVVSMYLRMAATKYVYYMKHKKDMDEDISELLGDFVYLLGPDVIEIKASVDGRIKKKRLSKDAVISFVDKLRKIDDKLNIVEDIIIKYEDPKTHELKDKNIFEDKLIATKKVVRAKEEWSRVDSEQMYNKIIEAYNDLYEKIEKFLNGES
ncbi:hypothetical protein [Thermococcus aciditolerans]|uniref:hypothetical protein n=1 Tax=Thermococcus aciditolerans TaxID=2598455 RepID=UPI001FE7FD66|nr:hypothetical protein [Thermococcus aciditolerans]